MLRGGADLALHSMKDMETRLRQTQKLARCYRERSARRSVGEFKSLEELPEAARIGTASFGVRQFTSSPTRPSDKIDTWKHQSTFKLAGQIMILMLLF